MASISSPKVRLVRCPNCRNVLPERADVPVYMCGGCSTVLQVKNNKGDTEITSNLGELHSRQANESALLVSESTVLQLPNSPESCIDQFGRSSTELASPETESSPYDGPYSKNDRGTNAWDDLFADAHPSRDEPCFNVQPRWNRNRRTPRMPSNNTFDPSPILSSPSGEERLKLLTIMRQLQNQLNITNLKPPAYYDPSSSRQLPVRSHEYPQIPLSGERHGPDQAYRFPGQFGPHRVSNEPNSGHSYATSIMHSSFPMWTSQDIIKYRRERPHVSKKYLPPVAGGAPFITCPRCFQLLHLPKNIFAYKRKFHLIKCGSCSEFLRISLQDGTHIFYGNRNLSGEDPGLPDLRREDNMSFDYSIDIKGKGRMLGSSSSMSKGTSARHSLMGYPTRSQVFKKLEQLPSGSSLSEPKIGIRSKK